MVEYGHPYAHKRHIYIPEDKVFMPKRYLIDWIAVAQDTARLKPWRGSPYSSWTVTL